jgi:prepilin-type N-terminal cleavage/methylation domain-containing protein
MNKKNLKNIKGLTLIEMLIGVAVTALMMGAMFSTYTVVNNSYNQVTDKAQVSRSSRDILGMMIRDIR